MLNRGIDRRDFLGIAAGVVLAGCSGDRQQHDPDAVPVGGDGRIGTGSPRVAWVSHPTATSWDFQTGFFFDYVDQGAVNAMMDATIMAVTGATTAAAGWTQVMSAYRTGDLVAVKINTNDANWGVGYINATSETIVAVIRGLVSAGIPEDRIRIFDATRPGGGTMPARLPQRTQAIYPSVQFRDTTTASFNVTFPDQRVTYGAGGSDAIVNHLCEAQHLIALPLLKAIRADWGNSGALKLHQGTIRNPASNHTTGRADSLDPSRNPIADICANPHIKDKLRLAIADGLFGMWSGSHFSGPGEQGEVPAPWRSFGNGAPNALLASTDPVAIDAVISDIIDNERISRGLPQMARPIAITCAARGLGVYETSLGYGYQQLALRRVQL